MSRKEPADTKLNAGLEYRKSVAGILKERGLLPFKTTLMQSSTSKYLSFVFRGNVFPLLVKSSLSADFAQIELHWTSTRRFHISGTSKYPAFGDLIAKKTRILDKIESKWTATPRRYSGRKLTQGDLQGDLADFPDIVEPADISFIESFYNSKKPSVNYAQIAGHGFYSIGEDKARLGVDRLQGSAAIRARLKTRSTKKLSWGFLVAVKIKELSPSVFDLEEKGGRVFPPLLSQRTWS